MKLKSMSMVAMALSALLCLTTTGAMAQTETLLTTITATAKEQASYSTANVATVSFSYTAGGMSAYNANWGWWGYGWSATVTAAEGYTITKCVFYDDQNRTATDSEAPFVVETTEEDKTPKVNGTPILAYTSKGIKKIEVYGYVTPTAYETWAAANGVTGEMGDKDANGIYNAFRYVFGQPTGDFALIAGIDVGESEVVITTPAVANSEGVAVSVVESSDIAGETVTDTKALEAEGRAVFTKSDETPRFYRLKAAEAE